MRVLMLNYEYPPLGGGAGNATAYLLKELAKDPALAVDLVTSSTGEARTTALVGGSDKPDRSDRSDRSDESDGTGGRKPDSVEIHFLDIGKRGGLHYQTNRDLLAYTWRAWRHARRLAAARRYDLCHAFFGIPCGFIARRLGLPYLVSLRGSDVPFYNERFRVPDRLLFQRMSVRIWRNARAVVANSEGLRALALESAPDQPIEVVHNGVDTDAFRPGRRDWNGLRVVCAARLIRRKGIEYLLEAMGGLAGHDVRLTVVGTGNHEAALRARATDLGVADRVDFAGHVAHSDLAPVYQHSDVFVLPSLNEGMSNTALEAMACGLPIVMTDTGGARELLEDGENGYVIRKRASGDIVEKLRRYLEEPSLLHKHGQNSRDKAQAMTWARSAAAYKRLYERALGEAS